MTLFLLQAVLAGAAVCRWCRDCEITRDWRRGLAEAADVDAFLTAIRDPEQAAK